MSKYLVSLSAFLLISLAASAQQGGPPPPALNVTPGENLVIENIPPVPTRLAEETARYGDFRGANLYGWHPTRREILIGTRFADTTQVHSIAMPGGERKQLTFYPDRVSGAVYLPDGNSFIFRKDTGGGEWFQLYRYDLASGTVTLLTDGKSRNNGPRPRPWADALCLYLDPAHR